jgi:hypothetical protein
MDYKTPERAAWFEYLYRVTLCNNPSLGRRIRVDGLSGQYSGTTIEEKQHDLVLLGKHLSITSAGPGQVFGINGVRDKVLDSEDEDSVVTSRTQLYAFDPFWVSLGNYTTVKNGQNLGPMFDSWRKKHVVEERLLPDGSYLAIVLTSNGVSATEIVFSKEQFWMPLEARTFWDPAYNASVPPSKSSAELDKIKIQQIKKWGLISSTKTEWHEVTLAEGRKAFLPKKFTIYQHNRRVDRENNVVIDVSGWSFDKDVPTELFQEETFASTSREFNIEEGALLFNPDKKERKNK